MKVDDKDLQDGGMLRQTALLAGVTVDEWRAVAHLLPSFPDHQSLLRHLLRQSACAPTILLCFGDQLLLQYEGVLEWSWSPLHNLRSGQRIRGKNEIVDPSASLSSESLRAIFVKIEALVYKCVHLLLEEQAQSYRQRTEDYEKRLDRLASAKLITPDDEQLAHELYEARCQFAHSLKSVDQIDYLSVPMKDRWGSSGTMRTRKLKRYFLPDAFRFSETLLTLFKPVQAEQLDGQIFKVQLNAALLSDHSSNRSTPSLDNSQPKGN